VRRISRDIYSNFRSFILNPEKLEDILVSYRNICNYSGLEFKFFQAPNTDWDRLDISIRYRLNFIISEGIMNCIKHAQAIQITILLYIFDQELHLLIKDDGIGFQKTKSRSSLGLILTERNIQSLNGQITI